MAKLIMEKSRPLSGEVEVGGAKNAVLPIMAATLLTGDPCEINDVPDLLDVDIMHRLLLHFGATVEADPAERRMTVRTARIHTHEAPYELVIKMRASILALGPVLARTGRARIALPGGCSIGERPIDLHLKGFRMMGAKIEQEHGYIEASAPSLTGAKIYLDSPSVGATENIMMGAALADGVTFIENAAEEPEIVDLANFLNKMGARVKGAGTDTIRIEGVPELHGAWHNVIPDRIETGTFMVAAAITGGEILVRNVVSDHVKPVIAKLMECGVNVVDRDDGLLVSAIGRELIATDIKTLPYPGFPTDMQPQLMALLATVRGSSVVTETVFENRFMHVSELNRMGAEIRIEGRRAAVPGDKRLQGAKVTCTDLRAGAAMVLAGLAAEGTTEISDIYHIERGYTNLADKFRSLGAVITRVSD